jgi:hypothetical protein
MIKAPITQVRDGLILPMNILMKIHSGVLRDKEGHMTLKSGLGGKLGKGESLRTSRVRVVG